MASYPANTQLVGTQKVRLSGKKMTRAASGKPRFQQFYSSMREGFTVVHLMSVSELAAYQSFVDTNINLAVTFTYAMDSNNYNCQFEDYPVYSSMSGTHTTVTAKLVVV